MEIYNDSVTGVCAITVDQHGIQANSDFRTQGDVAGIDEVIIARGRSLSPFRHF